MADTPRRPPQAAAPPQGQSPLQQPFPPGKIIGKLPKDKVAGSNLTPTERKLLEQAGGNVDDPVALHDTPLSEALAEQVASLRRKADQVEGTPVPADTPPLKIPEPVDINQLPPEKQRETLAAVKAAMDYQAAERDSYAPEEIAQIPGMNEAYRAAAGHPDDVQIVDDMSQPPAQQTAVAPEPAPATVAFDPTRAAPTDTTSQQPYQQPGRAESSTDGNNVGSAGPDKAFDPVEPPAQPPPSPPKQPSGGGDAGGGKRHLAHCPQCNYNLSKDPLEITPHQKLSFMAVVLGEGRFRQEYPMFGGKMHLTLRGLLPSELDLAQHQLAHDTQTKRVLTPVEYNYMFENYKLAMAMERLDRNGQVLTFRPVAELTYDATKFVTPLPQLTAWLNDNVYKTDNVRRTIGQHWLTFGKIQDKLEARADDPDFWKAIEGAT